jgi:short-subunit dehydrogenase
MRNTAILELSMLVGGLWLGSRLIRERRRISLCGKTALVTGGSRGLGLALARELARQQARVAICARDADELAHAVEILGESGAKVHAFSCDLRDQGQIRSLVRNVQSHFGSIDLLINNAGVISVGPVETMDADDFRDAMDVNFWSAVHTTLAVLPGMLERGEGRIVNVGSIGGKIPVPHLAAYCASKFALVGFSSAMRTELARDGILVTTVNPGLMRTGSPRNATFKGRYQAEYAWFSIGDSLPGISMNATRAARKIVDAMAHGDAEVILSAAAKIAARIHGIAPAIHTEFLALINRLFPRAGDNGRLPHLGSESESWITQSVLRFLGRRAERQYNQL